MTHSGSLHQPEAIHVHQERLFIYIYKYIHTSWKYMMLPGGYISETKEVERLKEGKKATCFSQLCCPVLYQYLLHSFSAVSFSFFFFAHSRIVPMTGL